MGQKNNFLPKDQNQREKLLEAMKRNQVLDKNLRKIIGGRWNDSAWPESTWADIIIPWPELA